MNISVYLADGRICTFVQVNKVVMQASGEVLHPEPGTVVLSPVTVIAWTSVPDPELPSGAFEAPVSEADYLKAHGLTAPPFPTEPLTSPTS